MVVFDEEQFFLIKIRFLLYYFGITKETKRNETEIQNNEQKRNGERKNCNRNSNQ